MRKNCFSFITGCILSLFLSSNLQAADLTKADELFEKGTFQAALEEYDQIALQSKDSHAIFKAFYRSCESLTFLYRYGEAVERIRNFKGELAGQDQHRFLILKAEILRNFLVQYGGYQRSDVIDVPGKEIFRLTPKEIKEEITNTYTQLWESRAEIIKFPLKDEATFLDLKNVDFGMYPTVLDYVVQSWLSHILQPDYFVATETPNPEAHSLLADNFNQPLQLTDPSGMLAAEIMEELIRLHGKEYIETQERWKIKRLLLPVFQNYLYSYPKDKNYTDYALEAKNVLLRWVKDFRNPEAQAEALYQSAVLLNVYLYNNKEEERFKKAHDLCQRIEKEFPQTKIKPKAEKLRQQIEIPSLTLQPKPEAKPGANEYSVVTKNIKEVHYRLYPFDPSRVKELGDPQSGYRGFTGLFQSWPYPTWMKKVAESESPLQAWDEHTKDTGAYENLTQDIKLPTLDNGLYLVLASADQDFKFGSSLLSATVINVTDLILTATTGVTDSTLTAYHNFVENQGPDKVEDEASRWYVINAKTGEAVYNAAVDVLNFYDNDKLTNLKTDFEGIASLRLPISLSQYSGNGFSFDALAHKDDSYAVFQQPLYFNYNSCTPYEVFIETDRPIYRPGDKVQARVIVIKHTSSGIKTVASEKTIKVTALDTNYKEFFTKELDLNDFGSASTEFEIPTGRLLGQYFMGASYSDGRFNGNAEINFSVEEYKRPEFELKLTDAKKPWKYNEPVEIEGNAKYYFGGAVPDAPVNYKIRRQWYVPYCFRYWFGRDYSFDSGGTEIASGQVTTDKDGKFTIAFTPTPDGNNPYYGSLPNISAYEIEVDARDAGGRTIHATESYRAGKNAMYFEINPQKGFFFEKNLVEINSRQLTMNDAPLEGKASYEVYTLSDEAVEYDMNNYGSWQNVPVLQQQLTNVQNGSMAVSGKVNFDKDGNGTIQLKSLKNGTYRLVLKAKDSWGEEIKQDQIFVVAKDAKTAVALGAYSVTIPEKEEYEVGETARFLIGSALGAGKYFYEIWTGEYLHQKGYIHSANPVQVVEIPVMSALKGGFSLRWFGVKDFSVFYGQESVTVPWKEKKLSLSFDPFTAELYPGSEVSWGIKVSDQDNRPVSSEVLTLMYDRSLEYYFSSQYPWLDSLYLPRRAQDYNYGSDSARPMNVYAVPVTEGLLDKMLKAFQQPLEDFRVPGLRTWQTWEGEGIGQKRQEFWDGREMYKYDVVPSVSLAESNVAIPAEEKIVGFRSKSNGDAYGGDKKGELWDKISPSKVPSVETRKEFADTAFFKPHILTASDGKGVFTFKVPEQLTSWKVKAFAFTKNAQEGVVTEEAVTRKDLMVRVDIPRFFREKDKGTITAFVHNEGKEPLKGQLKIDVMEGKENVNAKINLDENTRNFTVEPHAQKSFDWLITIPPGVTTYKVHLEASAGKLTDAEERVLPILPSRERLMESRFVSLSGNASKKLEINLAQDPTRINESMNLQVDPQLFLTVMNTIPFLVEYPFECVEQILNKYVPLSIMHQVYEKHPEVKAAVSKIPKRSTPTPAWEKDDPNRLMKLMETPWVWESEGRPTIWPIIDLLEPSTVKAKEDENLEKLRSAQLPSGAFPWWPGGQADPYMTLYVLDGFSQARRYGVQIPNDMIERALAYVNKEIPLRLKPEAYELSLISMAAYVVTSYPQDDFPAAKEGFEAAKAWIQYLEKNIHALTQFGKAYLAYTYLHLGNTERANEILDMALDGSREDPIAGVYWAPEKYSWVWYSDTLEMHAFLLRALQELRPEDKRIDGMVQWILFNRKGNVWKSTKASVAAVYALLDTMNKKGSLVSDEHFKILWGKTNDSVTVAADDWLEKPLRWQKQGFDIVDADRSATVSKDGPGVSFASLTWTYSTDQIPQASDAGMLTLDRKFYRRVKEGDDYYLKPLKSEDSVNVGDEIEVQLKVNTRSQFEYVYLKDPKAAGFEAETLLSGWKYDPLWFYEEPRDSLSNFFMSWLPHGEYILRYRLRPTKPGTYRIGAATLQPMYAPEMTAHSDGFILNVIGK